MRSLLVALCAGALFAPTAMAASSVFDTPLETQQRPLPLPITNINQHFELTCIYYLRFMVKQIDEGEIGATQLSIIPIEAAGPKPDCQKENVPSENVVPDAIGIGYFKGVKGDYVFFNDADSENGGLAFAVVAAHTGEILFADSAIGELHSLTLEETALTLRYSRNFAGKCSVPQDGGECWKQIAAVTGLDAARPPDCASGYAEAKALLAKERCRVQSIRGTLAPDCLAMALQRIEAEHWEEDPSVIGYEVETLLKSGQSTTRPLGGEVSCYPHD
jgi:hypothetical protein